MLDLQEMAQYVPGSEFNPGDTTDEDVLSFPVAGGIAVELQPDGTAWWRRWDATGGLSVEEEAGRVSLKLDAEDAASVFRFVCGVAVQERLGWAEEGAAGEDTGAG